MVENVKTLAAAARSAGMPVIHVHYIVEAGAAGLKLNAPLFQGVKDADALVRGSWGAAPVDGLEPQEGDFVVEKMRMNGFYATTLETLLRGLGADTIVISGAWTNMSIEHTARHGADAGFEVVVVSDGTSTVNDEWHNVGLNYALTNVGRTATRRRGRGRAGGLAAWKAVRGGVYREWAMPPFKLDAVYSPTADQPQAIDGLVEGVESGARGVTLLGATGTGKTMTMAATIERLQRPALVLAHNKTLAAQLCNEFRTYFPANAVEYFVSYYDYYQPEAYVPSKDLYIEKDSAINQEIDRLRHAATAALFARRDVVIVASVSAIFGLGSPETYNDNCQILLKGGEVNRDELLRKLVYLQYNRNDTALGRGTFRVRGDTLEVFPAYAETAFRALLFGDEVERLQHFDPLTGELIVDDLEHVAIWPATHYNVKEGTMERAVEEIGRELNQRTAELEAEGKLLESHRLRQRTQYDMEMLREVGFCSGIENYSRILDGRAPGARPYCLIDYFPEDFVCFIDESHQTVPQLGAMYEGDRSRKTTLVDYGFRLPSALDNRPQTFEEFLKITPAARVRVRHPGAVRARALGEDRRADRPPDRDRRPRGRGARDAQPDRRPDARDPRRAPSATSARWSPRSRRR